MNSNLVSILQHLHIYERGKEWRDTLGLAKRVMVCRMNRRKVLHRIRHRKKGEKIRVLFLVSEVAKWKCQTVFEAMKQSEVFDPLIALTALSEQALYSDDEMEVTLAKNEAFFDRLGDAHVRAVKLHPRVYFDVREFGADIVFFQEPWRLRKPQTTELVSHNALACYIPYDLPTWKVTQTYIDLPFHKFLCFYYVLNERIAQSFTSRVSPMLTAVKYVPLGHPTFDRANISKLPCLYHPTVIYAPHWTFDSSNLGANYCKSGTFQWSGKAILEYAKTHSEFHWIFKPHPKLKDELLKTGWMPPEEVERYYKAWEEIGQVCLDGEYQGYFSLSQAMITDSGTFLLEYGVTRKPLIHLKNPHFDYGQFFQGLYETYYAVHDSKELRCVLQSVLEKKQDPLCEQRNDVLELLGLREGAGRRIVAHLESVCKKQTPKRNRGCTWLETLWHATVQIGDSPID